EDGVARERDREPVGNRPSGVREERPRSDVEQPDSPSADPDGDASTRDHEPVDEAFIGYGEIAKYCPRTTRDVEQVYRAGTLVAHRDGIVPGGDDGAEAMGGVRAREDEADRARLRVEDVDVAGARLTRVPADDDDVVENRQRGAERARTR